MLNIKLTTTPLWDNKVEGYIFLLKQDFERDDLIRRLEKDFYPHLSSILNKHSFIGKRGDCYILTALKNEKLIHLIFVGLGSLDKSWDKELEYFRRTIGSTIHRLKKLAVTDAVVEVPSGDLLGIETHEIVKQMATAAIMADYEFSTFKTMEKKTPWNGTLILSSKYADDEVVKNAFNEGVITSQALNSIKHYCDLPGNIATPTYLAEQAQKMAKERGLKCTVFGRDKALELGMGGFCAVDAGSDQDGKFIILEYHTKAKNAPTIAIVGKGITFDTGGISLKPSDRMKGMKFDMSGAAAVIGTMDAIAQLKPDINVVALAPTVENMPSGKAARQDDIITFMNGRTAEILSTDAEGRLILADALCYAEKFYNPEVIIDIATLTGAVVFALGHFYTALMTEDDALAEHILEVSKTAGERTWRLPLDEDYKRANATPVADLANSGAGAKYGAGTITAGWFLRHFVSKSRWAHLDVAGTAHDVPDISYIGQGATGAGVRFFVEFIMTYRQKMR